MKRGRGLECSERVHLMQLNKPLFRIFKKIIYYGRSRGL